MPKPNLTYAATNERRMGTAAESAALKESMVLEPNNPFFHSLNQQYERFGTLSSKQWAAFAKSFMSTRGSRPTMSGTDTGTTRKPDFDGTKVRELFMEASQNLKYPSMLIPGVEGLHAKKMKVYLSINSPKYAGCILFTAGAQDIDKKVYALVNKKGEGYVNYHSMEHSTPEEAEAICTAVIAFAADPVAYSKMTGIKYSHCCFCGLELTNKSSVYHGYGPICADNWNLSWGALPPVPETPDDQLADL